MLHQVHLEVIQKVHKEFKWHTLLFNHEFTFREDFNKIQQKCHLSQLKVMMKVFTSYHPEDCRHLLKNRMVRQEIIPLSHVTRPL